MEYINEAGLLTIVIERPLIPYVSCSVVDYNRNKRTTESPKGKWKKKVHLYMKGDNPVSICGIDKTFGHEFIGTINKEEVTCSTCQHIIGDKIRKVTNINNRKNIKFNTIKSVINNCNIGNVINISDICNINEEENIKSNYLRILINNNYLSPIKESKISNRIIEYTVLKYINNNCNNINNI